MGRPRKNLEKVPGVRIWKRKGEGFGARWKYTYADPDTGKPRTRTGSVDYDLTVEKARKVIRKAERIRLGLSQPAEERHEEEDAKGIREHLEDWKRSMELVR